MSGQLPPAPSKHPVLQHSLRYARDPFEFVEEATTECGDLYRMELPSVDDVFVLAHPDYLAQVLVDDIEKFGKTDDFRRAFGSGLISVEGQQWRQQRDILQPLFFRDRITGYIDEMVACIEQRLATWEDGETRDIEEEMSALTLEILFATLFGRELSPGEDSDIREAADGLNEWFAPTSWILPHWMPTPARRRFKESTNRLQEEVRTLLADGMSAGPPQQSGDSDTMDLLSRLEQTRDSQDGKQLTTEEIEDQLVTMVFAGHETTATALAFTWYLLATHPTIREEFYDELDAVLDGASPSLEDIEELEVTDRILTEALRLYPPIHTIPRKTTTDVEMNGYHIPKGHELHLSLIHIHRDEQFYDDPLEFRPDRWTDEFRESLPDFAYAPFGGGRRTCIGREFALLEAKIALAMIGQRFQLDWTANREPTLEPRITIRTENGMPMRLNRR
ncbi:cytochrome P450 [Haloarcula amylovorans]|uniref:cytochrome P450 n=1 Tax=Haloarcula amylovorans TaxID=2562280 RepID=UPI001075D42D|nr:cytochrome P450 [Halomicroarcula amylolytica]